MSGQMLLMASTAPPDRDKRVGRQSTPFYEHGISKNLGFDDKTQSPNSVFLGNVSPFLEVSRQFALGLIFGTFKVHQWSRDATFVLNQNLLMKIWNRKIETRQSHPTGLRRSPRIGRYSSDLTQLASPQLNPSRFVLIMDDPVGS